MSTIVVMGSVPEQEDIETLSKVILFTKSIVSLLVLAHQRQGAAACTICTVSRLNTLATDFTELNGSFLSRMDQSHFNRFNSSSDTPIEDVTARPKPKVVSALSITYFTVILGIARPCNLSVGSGLIQVIEFRSNLSETL